MKNPNAPHFYFDVDNTLIHLLRSTEDMSSVEAAAYSFSKATDVYGSCYYNLYLNKQMLDLLMSSHARGHIIVLWSAGGAEWARRIGDLIEERYDVKVDYCLSKPAWWADDKTSEYVLPDVNRVIPTIPKGSL